MVEYQLPKLRVAGSSPVARSKNEIILLTGCLRKTIWVAVAAATVLAAGCAAPHKKPAGETAIDRAVTLYIEGDYVEAERHLSRLVTALKSEEDRRTAYLYLGRTYLAVGEYAQAVEAFMSGKVLGGGDRFDRYLTIARQHIGDSPLSIRAQAYVTRAQLAALIQSVLGEDLSGIAAPAPDTVAKQERLPYVLSAVAAGIMDVLPDGSFYPDRKVTRSAFYFVVQRLLARLGVGGGQLEDNYYPQGVRSAIAAGPPGDSVAGGEFIAGNEAVRILQAIATASDPSRN